jgi:hypothetical protein
LPVQEQLRKQRVRSGSDFILTSDRKPYVNAEIFLDYIKTVFFRYLVGLRGLAEFWPERVVLVTDKCSAHVTDDVIRLLTEARVRVITFTGHTTQIFQVLDLKLFGVLERRPKSELPFENDDATAKAIMKVYHDFKQIMMPPNVRAAFQALEFNFETIGEPWRLFFDEKKLRGSVGLRELWFVDFPLDQL